MEQILKNEERVVLTLRKLYSQYGYRPFKMSRFEEYDLYVRNKDFLLSDQIITFSDRSGRLLALKPDVTLSIIKNVKDESHRVEKFYYNENVYRMDKESASFKEIMQTGLECVGDLSAFETAEVVLLAAQSLATMERPFVLDISHMGFLNAVLDGAAFPKEERKQAMALLHQKNPHEMIQLCKDCQCETQAARLLCELCALSGSRQKTITVLHKLVYTHQQRELLSKLDQICSILEQQGFDKQINIDFSAGSQMKYYSGIVFCGYLQGIPNVVLSGGQYDALLKKMKKNSKAIGFAIYLDHLQRIHQRSKPYDVDTVLLYSDQDEILDVLGAAQRLRLEETVQVSTRIPQEFTFRKLMKMCNGEAVLIEQYG